MFENFYKYIGLIFHNSFVNFKMSTSDEKGVDKYGYKEYIGGDYENIGSALSASLIHKLNLRKNDVFLDIGCGSLRVGKFLIRYLEKNNYLGLEPERKLIDEAIKYENIELNKNPQFASNYQFDFNFTKKPNYCFANSVFTHLNKSDINLCFNKLDKFTDEDVVFFATFSTTPVKLFLPFKSHSHRGFNYTINQIKDFGYKNNFKYFKYMGNEWGHPRKQHLFLFTKTEKIYEKYANLLTD